MLNPFSHGRGLWKIFMMPAREVAVLPRPPPAGVAGGHGRRRVLSAMSPRYHVRYWHFRYNLCFLVCSVAFLGFYCYATFSTPTSDQVTPRTHARRAACERLRRTLAGIAPAFPSLLSYLVSSSRLAPCGAHGGGQKLEPGGLRMGAKVTLRRRRGGSVGRCR